MNKNTASLPRSAFAKACLLITFLYPSAMSAEVLVNPDNDTVSLMHTYLSGQQPNFQNYVINSPEVINADEFSRQDLIRNNVIRLSEAYGNLQNVTALIFDVESSLLNWDSEREAFPISLFMPDYYIAVGDGVSFLNSQEARYWALPLDEAREIAKNLPSNRSINVRLQIDNLKISEHNGKFIAGNVAWVEVGDVRTGQVIGKYAPQTATKNIVDSEATEAAQLRISSGLSIPAINSTWDEVTNWISERSLHGDWIWNKAPFEERLRENSQPLDHRFRGESDILFLGFNPREGWRKNSIAAIQGTKISNDDTSLVGRGFSCHTEHVGDICGFFGFRVEAEKLRLKYIGLSFDTLNSSASEVASDILGEDLGIFNVTTDLRMRISNRTYTTHMYTLGNIISGAHPIWDLRRNMPNGQHAGTMVYVTSLDNFAAGNTAVSILMTE